MQSVQGAGYKAENRFLWSNKGFVTIQPKLSWKYSSK